MVTTYVDFLARHPEAGFFPLRLLSLQVSLIVKRNVSKSETARWKNAGTKILRAPRKVDVSADSVSLRLKFSRMYARFFECVVPARKVVYKARCRDHVNCIKAAESVGKSKKAKIIHVPLSLFVWSEKRGTFLYRGETGERVVEGIVQRSLRKYADKFGESVSYVSENPRPGALETSNFRGKHAPRFSWQDVRQDLALQLWYALLTRPTMTETEAENILMTAAKNRYIDYYRRAVSKNALYLIDPLFLPSVLTQADSAGEYRFHNYAEDSGEYS